MLLCNRGVPLARMSLIFDDQPNITWWDDVKIWPTNCSVKNQFGQWDKTLTFFRKESRKQRDRQRWHSRRLTLKKSRFSLLQALVLTVAMLIWYTIISWSKQRKALDQERNLIASVVWNVQLSSAHFIYPSNHPGEKYRHFLRNISLKHWKFCVCRDYFYMTVAKKIPAWKSLKPYVQVNSAAAALAHATNAWHITW